MAVPAFPSGVVYLPAFGLRVGQGASARCDGCGLFFSQWHYRSCRPREAFRIARALRPFARFGVLCGQRLPEFDGGRGRRADIQDFSSCCARLRRGHSVAALPQSAHTAPCSRCTCSSHSAAIKPMQRVPLATPLTGCKIGGRIQRHAELRFEIVQDGPCFVEEGGESGFATSD